MYTIVILAAGASRRLGQPKQLLPWKGKNLLQYTLDEAESLGYPVLVVLGAHYSEIEDQLVPGPQTTIVFNPEWSEGMASSVRLAVEHAGASAEYLLFCVCDQPYLAASELHNLLEKQRTSRMPIVSAAYSNGAWGVPMLLYRTFFPELLNLRGDTGAKKIAAQYPNIMATFDFPLGYLDVDTLDDYAQLTHP